MDAAETPTTPLAAAVDALDSPLVEAFGMLLEAHNELNTAVTNGLRDSVDLPLPWVAVLLRLARSPDRRMRMSELARDMTMSNSGLTRLVDRIEATGHVSREACADDRRGMNAVLTRSGVEMVAAAAPSHLEDLHRLIGAELEPDEIELLTGLLRRVRDRARATSDDAS